MQALEAVKLAAGVGEPLSRRLLLLDCLTGRFSAIKLRAKVGALALLPLLHAGAACLMSL
jgi:molybdopterin/thiamine biosynthesis adenylyltransferase